MRQRLLHFKKIWYYGIKIHILAEERSQTLPTPRRFLITKASEHDLNTGKIILKNAEDFEVLTDKAYIDEKWGYELQLRGFELNTPFKERSKNQIPLDDGECAWNTMITSSRQQIETLVSQISEITSIQDAHFVRSENALLSFLWARLALLAISYW